MSDYGPALGRMFVDCYLEGPRAVEDVTALLRPPSGRVALGGDYIDRDTVGSWERVQVVSRYDEPIGPSVYFRPDGDRFIVSDLGEAVRALRLRTGALEVEVPQHEGSSTYSMRTRCDSDRQGSISSIARA